MTYLLSLCAALSLLGCAEESDDAERLPESTPLGVDASPVTPCVGSASGLGCMPDATAWTLPGLDAGQVDASAGLVATDASRQDSATADAQVPTTDAATSDAQVACKRSTHKADQVVVIGDSFLAFPTSAIASELETLWKNDGSPGYSPSPRFHQLVGMNMTQIAAQYDDAHKSNPDIKVVVGNGGGNDVLVNDRSCLTSGPLSNPGCAKTVENAMNVAETLMAKMEADGVEHLIYMFYPRERTFGLYQGDAPAINDSLDYAEPRARAVCARHPICLLVALREATGEALGSPYTDHGYINDNDVHPSAEGSRFYAKYMWDRMKEACILHP